MQRNPRTRGLIIMGSLFLDVVNVRSSPENIRAGNIGLAATDLGRQV